MRVKWWSVFGTHDAPMTTTSHRIGWIEESTVPGKNAGAVRAAVRFVAVLVSVGLVAGLATACQTSSPGEQPSSPATSSPATTTASPNVSETPSPGASESAACTQLQTAGATLSDTWQRYTAGQVPLSEVVTAVENLVAAAKVAGESSSGALHAQAEDVKSATQDLDTTLRASPPPNREQIKASAQRVLDALKAMQLPCQSNTR